METPNEIFTIRTPEQVGFQYVLAGLGTRATALLLDTAFRALLVLSIFLVFIISVQFFPGSSTSKVYADVSKTWLMAIGFLLYGVIDLGYFLLFEALWSGQTPGKRLQKIRVIRIDGQPIGWLESSIRNILRGIDILGGIYPLGLIVIFLSGRNQRFGDYAAGTIVILERRRHVPAKRAGLRTGTKGNFPNLEVQVTTLEPEQYQLILSFLERRQEMDRSHRQQLASELARRLMGRWKISPKERMSYESFLEEVVGIYEKRRRAI